MNIYYFIYKLASTLFLSIGIIPFLVFSAISGKYWKNLQERFGYLPGEIKGFASGVPRLWIHAVSLGEIKVAKSIIDSIKESVPECSVILSTTTEHGRDLANEMFSHKVPVIYAPIDFFLIVKKVVRFINPDILVFLETEIWPSWIIETRKQGTKIALLNGRISQRSFKSYLRFKLFFKKILSNLDIFSMISEIDRERILMLGAAPEKTTINGNAKYDSIIEQISPGREKEIRDKLLIDESTPVIVAGSTRTGEEDIILNAYKKILRKVPETIFIIAPRHLERVGEIIRLVEKKGFAYHLRTEFDNSQKERKEKVIIIDKYGELFDIYSIATIAFCGASLVPLGGQNPFEPAAWGVPVFHGPYMDDFQDARLLLEETGGNVEVSGEDEFADQAVKVMSSSDMLKKKGDAARKALLKNRNAATKHAMVIKELLSGIS